MFFFLVRPPLHEMERASVLRNVEINQEQQLVDVQQGKLILKNHLYVVPVEKNYQFVNTMI